MRVIAGELRGSTLKAPRGMATRPTSSMVREAVFNHLAHGPLAGGFDDLEVLDLFAGSGALGIEALSRGARRSTFVDRAPAAIVCIKENLDRLRIAARAAVVTGVVPRDLARLPCRDVGLVFCDPPYRTTPAAPILEQLVASGIVARDAVVVWEDAADALPMPPARWEQTFRRAWSDTGVVVWCRRDDTPGSL